MAGLHRNHSGITSRQQVLGCAIPEVARVLHVEWNGVGATKFVSYVLGADGSLDAKFLKARCDLCLEDLAYVHFGDAQMPVRIAFDLMERGKIVRVDIEYDSFRNHRYAVPAPRTEPLDNGANERVDDRFQPQRFRKFLGNECECRSGC